MEPDWLKCKVTGGEGMSWIRVPHGDCHGCQSCIVEGIKTEPQSTHYYGDDCPGGHHNDPDGPTKADLARVWLPPEKGSDEALELYHSWVTAQQQLALADKLADAVEAMAHKVDGIPVITIPRYRTAEAALSAYRQGRE